MGKGKGARPGWRDEARPEGMDAKKRPKTRPPHVKIVRARKKTWFS